MWRFVSLSVSRIPLRPALRLACAMLLPALLAAPGGAAQQLPGNSGALYLRGVEASNAGRQGIRVLLSLSAPVEMEELKKHLTINPPVGQMRIEFDSYRDNAFQIYGDWVPEREYELTVTAGLRDSAGVELARNLVTKTRTPKVNGMLAFGQENKYYFPRRNGPKLVLESRGVPEVAVSIGRLFPNNLPAALDWINNGEPSEPFYDNWCEELKKQDLKIAGPSHVLVKTPLELEKYLDGKARGVYFVGAADKKYGEARENAGEDEDFDWSYSWLRNARKLVIQTDLGLLAHWRDGSLVLFAHDLTTVKPLFHAKVTVWSNKNQKLGEGHTGLDGIAVLDGFKPGLGTPKVAVVEHSGDFSFLELQPRTEDAADIEANLSEYNDGYEAFLYADRELYRPGETARLRWLVRKDYGDAAGPVPLIVRVVKPNGKNLLERPTQLSELGTGGLDLPTQRVYPTGAYTVEILVPGEKKKSIGSYTLYLEDFVPSRMKATVATTEDRWLAGRQAGITVTGEHLFGGPASDRMAEAVVTLLGPGSLGGERWKNYHFGNELRFRPARISCGQNPTGKDGKALFQFTWRPETEVTYPVRASVTGKVYELGGRAVNARKEVTLFPTNGCLGIGAAPGGRPRTIGAAVASVSSDGSPSSMTQALVSLEKQVWNYNVRRYTSNWEESWSQSFREMETRTVALRDGVGSTTFTVAGYGYYRLRVHSPATPQYSTTNFYCWGDQVEIIEAAQPSLIKVTPSKASYEVGEKAELRIEAPFDGRAFVVIQGNDFVDEFTTEIKNKAAKIEFRVKREHFPCVWAQVTAVHSVARQPMLVSPFSSFAQAPVRVTDPARKLQVSFPALPEETRPDREVEFTVEVLDHKGRPVRSAELTLAAVDEGIHITTGYKNPDPWGWLTRLRKPSLNRAHYYDKIAYDFDEPPPGGDLGEMGKRLGTPGENWIKPLALWSGPVVTDKKGRTVVRMRLPEFAGQLRLVAVACSENALGAQAGQIYVRRPVMLQTSQPRFVLPGDIFRGEAVLYNRSGGPCKAQLSWLAGGAIVNDAGETEVEVPAGGEANHVVNFKVDNFIGQALVTWRAVFYDASGKEIDRIRQETPIPVTPPAAFQSANEFFLLKPGEKRELRNTAFVEGPNTEMHLTAGADMLLRLQSSLAWVLHYPYGCVEQTTSRLFPLYLLRQATAVTSAPLAETGGSIDDVVRGGVDRLFSMQTADGGLAYWPGGTESYPYGSVYALHCLTVMKNDRQVEIPKENFAALQRYVGKLAKMQVENPTFFPNLFLRSYAVAVLGLGGDADSIAMIESFDKIMMPRPARYLLAAALARATGDPERVKKYLAETPSRPWEERQLGDCLSSPIRNAAIEMMALQEAKIATPGELESRARLLLDWIDKTRYPSTQETSFVVTALAGYLSGRGDAARAAVTITDPQEMAHAIKGAEVYHGDATGAGKAYRVANTGGADVAINFTTRGMPLQAEDKAITQGLAVSRQFMLEGNAVTSSADLRLRQTASPIVRLDITVPGAAVLQNVIVSDLLPAGLEVENPKLSPDATPGVFMKDAAVPQHLELRDDRLVLAFDTLKPGTHHFYYMVRAVTPGRFQYPAVEAECMYAASIRGRSGLGTLEVIKP